MAAWRRDGHVDQFETRIKDGMAKKGYDADFADAIFKQNCGFGEYGFPDSHAYSFALLAYVSLWMKCHQPAIFLAALINSQPMGFYAPAQLVQDARRHGVEVRPVDVCESDWDCSLERRSDGGAHPAVRLGLRLVSTLSQAAAERLTQARRTQGFASVDALARRAGLDTRELQALAQADALQSLAGTAVASSGRPPARSGSSMTSCSPTRRSSSARMSNPTCSKLLRAKPSRSTTPPPA